MANTVTYVNTVADERKGSEFQQGTIVRVKRYVSGTLYPGNGAIDRPAIVSNVAGISAVIYLDSGTYDRSDGVMCVKAGSIRID